MNNITELVFIVDCSKAMTGFEFETVSRINSITDSYRNKVGITYINTFIFNGESDMIHDRLKISDVKPLTISDIKTGGDSAMYDTTVSVIKHIRNIHHYIRPEDIPQNTLFYIFSGGFENASVKYGRSTVKNMIDERRKRHKWEFYFEKENIYTAKRDITLIKTNTDDRIISDSDFEVLMKILNSGKSGW